ncbi:glutamate formimidoyltransferase [Patescibacteria group bacterium]|nr:glutamate formimidoyltransferase [Patescibacteria group bacterium]MBU2633124.1 glutamate formimidoyltransferase [Patescibacteria group bacterium]
MVECVPNISEGHDKKKIKEIVSVVEREGVKLLDVNSDAEHNRSVITFAGEPEAVLGVSFDLIKKASELIDMSVHKGEHPRMGAVDVCPFIPVAGVDMDDCVDLAHRLGKMLGEAGIPGYFYGYAAKKQERKILSSIRKGEYESLSEKLKKPEWKPDFGPTEFNSKFGAVAVGVRDFLIAYNVNLKSDDLKLANDIARIIRNSGDTRVLGAFKTVQATGVDTRDKGYIQVSMNLTDYKVDSMEVVFETIKRIAKLCDIEIHSTEVVGLTPKDIEKALEI